MWSFAFQTRNGPRYNNISVNGVHGLAKSLEERWQGHIVHVCNDVQVDLGHINIHAKHCNEYCNKQLIPQNLTPG